MTTMVDLYEVSYRPDPSAPSGVRDVTVYTPVIFSCDLSVINEHFRTIDTNFIQDDEEYMLIEDTRDEWYGDVFARRKPYVNRDYTL